MMLFSDSILVLRELAYGDVKYGKTLRDEGYWKDYQRIFMAKSGAHAPQIVDLLKTQAPSL
eukprot:2151803-Prorocentrum_lima.AAC.1